MVWELFGVTLTKAGCNDFSQQRLYVITFTEQPEQSDCFSRGHRESPVVPLLLVGSTDSVSGYAGARQLPGWLNRGAAHALTIAVWSGGEPQLLGLRTEGGLRVTEPRRVEKSRSMAHLHTLQFPAAV